MRKTKKYGIMCVYMARRWTGQELEYLSDNAGYLNHDQLAKGLRRSRWAVKHKQFRMGIKFIDNVYTYTLLSSELGRNRRRIRLWYERGWLKGTRADWSCCYGKRPMLFREEDVAEFLREHCDLFPHNGIPNRYFSNIVQKALVENGY